MYDRGAVEMEDGRMKRRLDVAKSFRGAFDGDGEGGLSSVRGHPARNPPFTSSSLERVKHHPPFPPSHSPYQCLQGFQGHLTLFRPNKWRHYVGELFLQRELQGEGKYNLVR